MWFGLYSYVCSYELNGKIQANEDTNTEIAQARSTEKLFLYVYKKIPGNTQLCRTAAIIVGF